MAMAIDRRLRLLMDYRNQRQNRANLAEGAATGREAVVQALGGAGRGGSKTKPECTLESMPSEIIRLSSFQVRRDASSGIRFSCPFRFRFRINDARATASAGGERL